VVLLGLGGQEGRPEPLRVAADDLRPGLAAMYRGWDGSVVHRIDPKPAFAPGDSSPHPRIPPGPFEATWEGVFSQPEQDTLRFGAAVGGDVTVTLGGVDVLEGGKARAWTPGLYRLRVHFRSRPGIPARLQLWWEGAGFSREPLPPWRFRHMPAELPAAAREDARAERGREAVERLGCARCHRSSFPSAEALPPGPSLEGAGRRLDRGWLLRWLEKPGGRMPALFPPGPAGLAERSLVADYLLAASPERQTSSVGDPRKGRKTFLAAGCAACHFPPDLDRAEQGHPERTPLDGLAGRWTPASLAAFLENPRERYPDGRMPRIPLTAAAARDVAGYLLAARSPGRPASEDPAPDALAAVMRRLGVSHPADAGRALVREKRCAPCHPGLGATEALDIPIRHRAAECAPVRFLIDSETKDSIAAYRAAAPREVHASPFESRRRLLERRACGRCHARDTDRPPPIEEVAGELGGAGEADLYRMPFQRTPRLTYPLSRYRRSYVRAAVRDGVSGVRPSWYSYRMPAFGPEADEIVRALAEADGDLADEPDPPHGVPDDPTLPGAGPSLVGYEGYSCVSCHLWKGQSIAEVEHGSVGPELTSVAGRVRRDWFDRWLEDPARSHPGTPMPQIFRKGQPATIESVLGGDANRQKDALWAYFAKGKEAPDPRSLPPVPVTAPRPGEPPLVAVIPIHLPDKSVVESLCVLTAEGDLLLYDLGANGLREVYLGAEILRVPRDRRSFALKGTPAGLAPERLTPSGSRFVGFERLGDGVRIRSRAASGEVAETLRFEGRRLIREASGNLRRIDLPAVTRKSDSPGTPGATRLTDPGVVDLSGRPGYRAIAYPRPKTALGEDLVMPGAIVADPKDGQVYVASMKMGDLFALRDPGDDGRAARFVNFAGLFQDAYSMAHDGEWLYVLHRRNLTRLRDSDGDGTADVYERVAALDHAVRENVDNAYGLVREPSGSFVFTYASNTGKNLPGWGAVLRLTPGEPERKEELAFGLRRAYGACLGPEGDLFFTDNQGEWVATNKLCRADRGRYYGFPNPGRSPAGKPPGKAAVWVPYGWARSTNGVVCDTTGGAFGPFAGQFFLAEMMYGGAIVRAHVETVNGEAQGACFPFWGKGLLGPLVLAFDPKGRLYVGGLTDASCGSQPDRGALFRLEFTGRVPFEIREIRARPRGFRLVFTRPTEPATARDPDSYTLEHYRYEYTGAYGSPELDRTRVPIERVELAPDGASAELTVPKLVPDRVYLVSARGVRSPSGEPLVHPSGAYTLNAIPAR
jgi:cytochrome c2/glucose/arabinose dehydrogenase